MGSESKNTPTAKVRSGKLHTWVHLPLHVLDNRLRESQSLFGMRRAREFLFQSGSDSLHIHRKTCFSLLFCVSMKHGRSH
jgi:hypothetical protein